jgi:hypothetical protein
LLSWVYLLTMPGGGQRRPPGRRTAEYNTAFDLALAFANLRKNPICNRAY